VNNIYSYNELLTLTEGILRRRHGYSEKEAAVTARVLVEADARGVPSHGVSRLDFYLKHLRGGFVKVGAEPEIVWETPVSLVVDGHDGVGAYVSSWSVQKLIDKAAQAGNAFCAVRNSSHFGIAGLWAEQIAKNDMIGMAFTNAIAGGIPTFGRERTLGTNPIAVAIPESSEKGTGLFLLDMATTTVAAGKIGVYDRRKKQMPPGWVVDEDGNGVTDAAVFNDLMQRNDRFGGLLFLGGKGEETGGHKGFGLGLLVEILCSGLSLGASSLNLFQPGGGAGITHFFGALRLDLFGESAALKAHIGAIIDDIRLSETAAGQDRIYIHGEKEAEARAKALRDGIFIDDATCALLDTLAQEAAA
jgi:LDH2 family malate/lactate/ureidoglycolate dehydrogenase